MSRRFPLRRRRIIPPFLVRRVPPSPYRFPSSSRRFPFFPWSPPPLLVRSPLLLLLLLLLVFPSSSSSLSRPPLPYSFPLLQPLLFVMSPLVAFPSPRDLIHLPCRCCLVGLPAVSSIHPCVVDSLAVFSIGPLGRPLGCVWSIFLLRHRLTRRVVDRDVFVGFHMPGLHH